MKSDAGKPLSISRTPWLWLAGLFLLALLVRIWRLEWQPLWWDEGYSVYFATEPFMRMLWLTAHDIHPPLYYALLQLWILLFGEPSPLALRLFSVVLGAASVPALFWAAQQFYPKSTRTAWIAALLLAFSPMHLYYSQEVRMYALATLLAIFSTTLLWLAVQKILAGQRAALAITLYAAATLLLIYTLYYGALLLMAQMVWVGSIWALNAQRRGKVLARSFGTAWFAIFILYLPWLIYALPKLIPYVQQKVASDQDSPLAPTIYLVRHMSAFLAGHVQSATGIELWAIWLVVLGIGILAVELALTTRKRRPALDGVRMNHAPLPQATPALALFVAIPFLAGWLINLVNPFFPEGGERLLLFVLPLALLLIGYGIDQLVWRLGALGWISLPFLVVAGLIGIYVFYTTPRHTHEDYRPLLADIAHAGRDEDTIFATFPWQVGYWRAYKPRDVEGPDPFLMSPFAIEYSPQLERDLQWMLAEGTLWFPEPLAFGSRLPQQMEAWLAANAANLENRWYSLTTRLTAWSDVEATGPAMSAAHFGEITLLGSAIGAEGVAANNAPLPVTLLWDRASLEDSRQGVTLRLQDGLGRTWASRDYAPVGAFARGADSVAGGEMPAASEQLGLLVPPGTPPGTYRLMLGVTEGDQLIRATSDDGQSGDLIELGSATVVNPPSALPLGRFDMGTTMRTPDTSYGLTVVGYTTPVSPTLAGTLLPATIFARTENAARYDREIELYLEEDAGTSSWRGWPLPDYPASQWQMGLTTRVPLWLRISPYLATGRYHLKMRWIDAESDEASDVIDLGTIEIEQRQAAETVAPPAATLEPIPQFGSHALLRGYTLERSDDALDLALTWEVVQPLVPEHNVFVHLDAADGSTIVQADGPPMTSKGSAPTSTWRPGETIVTEHLIVLPGDAEAEELLLRVGLYEPNSEVRLPVSVEGVTTGDSVEIPPPQD